MARKQKDIHGYRRSHRRIPTEVAMTDDRDQLAKSAAVGKLSSINKEPGKKLLKDFKKDITGKGTMQPVGPSGPGQPMGQGAPTYQRFERQGPPAQGNPGTTSPMEDPNQGAREDADSAKREQRRRDREQQRRDEAGLRQEGEEEKLRREGDPEQAYYDSTGNRHGIAGFGPAGRSMGNNPLPPPPAEEDPAWQGLYDDLQSIYDQYRDPELSEERIQRARANQAAAVRARMGTGEAAMSGAAALLEEDAGRLAESQARAAELERDLGIAELGSYLMGFDLDKERYEDQEQYSIAMAALWSAEYYEADTAEELIGLLGVDASKITPEYMAMLQAYLDDNREDGDGGRPGGGFSSPAAARAAMGEDTKKGSSGTSKNPDGSTGPYIPRDPSKRKFEDSQFGRFLSTLQGVPDG